MLNRNFIERSAAFIIIAAAFIACSIGEPQHQAQTRAHRPTLVFMTDFGAIDDSVAICKGVMLGIEPDLRIIDITHEVIPYSVLDGARFLAGAAPYFESGAVFVVVIDPGVGSARRALAVKSKRGQYFVLPDNGLITLIQDRDGIEGAREITNAEWMIGGALSSTFHGRDIFSPVGARLARGDDWTKVGPPANDLVRLNITAATLDERGINGEVIGLDGPYGNLITNIDGDQFRKLGYALGDKIKATIGEKEIELPFAKTFSDAAENAPLLYIDSRGRIGLAINLGNFAETYKIKPPVKILISKKL